MEQLNEGGIKAQCKTNKQNNKQMQEVEWDNERDNEQSVSNFEAVLDVILQLFPGFSLQQPCP